MGDFAFDKNMTGSVPEHFAAGGGLQNLPGSQPPRKHKLHRSNIEQEANEDNQAKKDRGFDKFPLMLHKQAGLSRIVHTEEQLADALSKGWYDDIRNVPSLDSGEMPDRVSRMTEAQAFAFIAEHASDPAKIAEIQADETSHGNRIKVLKAIEEAADSIGAPVVAEDVAEKPKKGKK